MHIKRDQLTAQAWWKHTLHRDIRECSFLAVELSTLPSMCNPDKKMVSAHVSTLEQGYELFMIPRACLVHSRYQPSSMHHRFFCGQLSSKFPFHLYVLDCVKTLAIKSQIVRKSRHHCRWFFTYCLPRCLPRKWRKGRALPKDRDSRPKDPDSTFQKVFRVFLVTAPSNLDWDKAEYICCWLALSNKKVMHQV